MKIKSIIFCRRFEKDPETIAYSPANVDEVANLIEKKRQIMKSLCVYLFL